MKKVLFEDPLGPMRGIVVGIAVGLLLWALLFFAFHALARALGWV